MLDHTIDTDGKFVIEFSRKHPEVLTLLEKVANDDDVDGVNYSELSPSAFIDSENRMFPVHTKKDAVLSYIYAQDDGVPDWIKEAAEDVIVNIYGMEPPNIEKVASEEDRRKDVPEDMFVFPQIRKLPVVDKDTAMKSEFVLEKIASEVHSADFFDIVTRYVDIAKKVGIDPRDDFSKMAAEGAIDGNELSSILMSRFMNTGDDWYAKVASDVSGRVISDREDIRSIVKEILNRDKQNDIDSMDYVSAVDEDYTDSVKIAGIVMPYKTIKEIDPHDIADILGDSAASAIVEDNEIDVEKLASFINALGEEDAHEVLMELGKRYNDIENILIKQSTGGQHG